MASRFCLMPLLALAALLPGCVSVEHPPAYYRPTRTVLAADRVELPVTFAKNYPFVEARINGEGPFYLLLDSGCHALVLLPQAAKRAHVESARFTKGQVPVNGGRGFIERSIAQVNQMEAGGLSLENVNALVAEVESDTAEVIMQVTGLKAENFDGALGLSALHDVILEIDYPNKKVAVLRRGAEQFPQDRSVACNFSGGIGKAKLQIGDKTITATIDTGSDASFETTSWTEIPLLFPQQKIDGPGYYGAGGRCAREEWGQLSTDIRLGPITWENAMMTNNHGTEAFIGMNALTPWKVVFDQQAGLIYFLGESSAIGWPKTTAPDPRFKFGYYGEFYGGGIRLLEVDAGGAFDRAGLRVGDTILSIEGYSAVDWAYRHVPAETLKQPRLQVKATRNRTTFEPIVVQGQD